MIVKTGRFGQLNLSEEDQIAIPAGLLGFPEYKKFCIVDPGDDVLILYLQSLENPDFAIAILEPKIFKPDYTARLSAAELRELKLENINQSAVFSILTIGEDITQMSANLKAPLVINLRDGLAKQVVLQENENTIKHPMFKELRAHLMTAQSAKKATQETERGSAVVSVRLLPPSLTVRSLQA